LSGIDLAGNDLPNASFAGQNLAGASFVILASQVGRTFDLVDWTGVSPIGSFAISSPYRWNVSNLYTTGEVTLTAIPEPKAAVLLLTFLIGSVFLIPRRLGAAKNHC
jgi:hypothetical protein